MTGTFRPSGAPRQDFGAPGLASRCRPGVPNAPARLSALLDRNPWSGSYVYNSGNLVLDLLYNLMLESTGRLQKCRIYEMTANKTARSTIAYLIVRDPAHENAYANALESLGVDWGRTLPIPKTNAEKFPEVKKLVDLRVEPGTDRLADGRPAIVAGSVRAMRRPLPAAGPTQIMRTISSDGGWSR